MIRLTALLELGLSLWAGKKLHDLWYMNGGAEQIDQFICWCRKKAGYDD